MTYRRELAWRLIEHFSFPVGDVPPTFSGFRQKEGLTLADFRRFAKRRDFASAIEEAEARLRDTLTAGALVKKYDATFLKHLLCEEEKGEREGEAKAAEAASPLPFSVEIRVVE